MGNALCFVCERAPDDPFVIAGFGTVCGGCVETLRGAALATLALDPTSRPVLETKMLDSNPFTRIAAARAVTIQDAVNAAAFN